MDEEANMDPAWRVNFMHFVQRTHSMPIRTDFKIPSFPTQYRRTTVITVLLAFAM